MKVSRTIPIRINLNMSLNIRPEDEDIGCRDSFHNDPDLGVCPECGSSIVGDGVTVPRHCECIEVPMDREADAPLLTCREADDAEMQSEDARKRALYLEVLVAMAPYLPSEFMMPSEVEDDVCCHVLGCEEETVWEN